MEVQQTQNSQDNLKEGKQEKPYTTQFHDLL